MGISPYVKFEQSERSDTLLITFAALAGTAEAPAFCFGDVAKRLDTNKLFFVDPHSIAYQKGIPGVGSDFWEISKYIKEIQQQQGIRRTTVIGNSSGGFAALIVGSLIGADVIHAFNPPTLLSDISLTHSKVLHKRLQAITGPTRSTYDLGAFLRQELTSSSSAFVYYSRGNTIDCKRTPSLSGISGVHLVGYPYPEHDLARYLARQGTVTNILEASLADDKSALLSFLRRSRNRARIQFAPNMIRWAFTKLKNRWKASGTTELLGKPTTEIALSVGDRRHLGT